MGVAEDARLFSIAGFSDSAPPWAGNDSNATKAKAVLFQRRYCDSDDLKRRLWANLVVIFRALNHFGALQFDRDFYKIVSDACHLAATNANSIKDLAGYWSRRRLAYLRANGRDSRDGNLLTELVDAWQVHFNRWRDKKMEYVPNVTLAIDTKVQEWSEMIRNVDDLLDSRNSPSRQGPGAASSPPRGPSRRSSIHDPAFGRKRSASPKRESEEHDSIVSSKRRCTGPVGGFNSPALSLSTSQRPSGDILQSHTPITPNHARQIDDLILGAVQPPTQKSEGASTAQDVATPTNTTPTAARLPRQSGVGRAPKELFPSLKERLDKVEGKLRQLPADRVTEDLQKAQEDLAESVKRLEDRLGATDDKIKGQSAVSATLQEKCDKNEVSLTGLQSNVRTLEASINDIRARDAVSASFLPPSDGLREQPVSAFRQLYLDQPGLTSLFLLTEAYLGQIDTRCQNADERMTRAEVYAEESARLQNRDPGVGEESFRRLEDQIAVLTRQASETERLVKEQAEQIRQQNATISELQTKPTTQFADLQQQLNAVNLTVANHSTNLGLESRMITVLDMARVYHRRENFVSKAQMEASARMVISLEAAVNQLMNSKGK